MTETTDPQPETFVPPAAVGLPLAALDSATEGADRLDASARTPYGRNLLAHALIQLARDGWLRAAPAAVPSAPADRAAEDAPLSPFYEHSDCGFHWHGRDGMDIPMRDGQPVCPRCELAAVEKRLAHVERRRIEVGEESRRRGKTVLEYGERIRALEQEIDGIQRRLGAEILRADEAEAELRRMADEAQQAPTDEDVVEVHRLALSFALDLADETQTLPQPEGPEYTPCACDHIEPEHEPNAGACRSCDCEGYRATPSAPLRRSWDDCPGFPEQCPNLRPVDPDPPVHLGGIRCGCADEEHTP